VCRLSPEAVRVSLHDLLDAGWCGRPRLAGPARRVTRCSARRSSPPCCRRSAPTRTRGWPTSSSNTAISTTRQQSARICGREDPSHHLQRADQPQSRREVLEHMSRARCSSGSAPTGSAVQRATADRRAPPRRGRRDWKLRHPDERLIGQIPRTRSSPICSSAWYTWAR